MFHLLGVLLGQARKIQDQKRVVFDPRRGVRDEPAIMGVFSLLDTLDIETRIGSIVPVIEIDKIGLVVGAYHHPYGFGFLGNIED